ncbi:hypothetical protein HDU80_010633 [Chytriomyces hyalinus]|nr:hypothetical protein HDU80_010633 [Chytriomyces hyalinus]
MPTVIESHSPKLKLDPRAKSPNHTFHCVERTKTGKTPSPHTWPIHAGSSALSQHLRQLFAHIVSTTLIILLLLTSYIQDISTVIETYVPWFYNLFPQPPERSLPITAISDEQNRILAHSHVQKRHSDLANPRKAIRRNSRSFSSNLTSASNYSSSSSKDSVSFVEHHEDVQVVDDDKEKTRRDQPPPPSFLKRIASYTNEQRKRVITSPLRREPSRASHSFDLTPQNDYRRPNQNVRYYIEKEGFQCDSYNVTTRDGFILRLERISPGPGMDQTIPQSEKPPIILMHGMFQSAGVWVTSGRKSFAFYLAENNYDVWVANNRTGCQEAAEQHAYLKSSEASFWDWCLDDLAGFDVPAVIEAVRRFSGWQKVGYVGHSQGNAQMFMALKMDPSLNEKLSCFVALAPAVYIGSLLDAFPVNQLVSLPSKTHRIIFGTKQFLPIMTWVQKYIPATLMAELSYHMFHFLFDWGDTNWNRTHKTHFFQFTPRPQSSKLLHHWSQMARARVIRPFADCDEEMRARCDGELFDVQCIQCPLALYYGTKDAIVDARKLHWQCWETSQNQKRGGGGGGGDDDVGGGHVVDLVAVEEVEGYEHLDCLWATNAEEKVWRRVLRVFEGVGWE